jgi:hypothetical protein
MMQQNDSKVVTPWLGTEILDVNILNKEPPKLIKVLREATLTFGAF